MLLYSRNYFRAALWCSGRGIGGDGVRVGAEDGARHGEGWSRAKEEIGELDFRGS